MAQVVTVDTKVSGAGLACYSTCIFMKMCVIGLDVRSKMYYYINRTPVSLFDIYNLFQKLIATHLLKTNETVGSHLNASESKVHHQSLKLSQQQLYKKTQSSCFKISVASVPVIFYSF